MNTFILKTVIKHRWLTEDQVRVAQEAMVHDPSLSLLNFMTQQGWLGAEHIAWLQHAMTVHESSVALMSTEKEVVYSGIKTTNAPLPIPADFPFEVRLAKDGALDHLTDYLRIGQQYGASDVHIGVDAPPIMRLHGCLQMLWPKAPSFTASQTERLLMSFLTETQKAYFKEGSDLDFCYAVEGLGRFRTSVIRQRRGIDGVFRVINTKVQTMDELGLPKYLKGLTKYQNGLVLVTGSAGCGKSTTLAAFIEEVNQSRHDHIVTLEDPIEYVFEPKECQITQREIPTHTQSFSVALRAVLREDPDVIMVGEMRDLETISLAITASETGHLVFGTLHTSSAARTLDRILDVFPTEQQSQIRTMVSGSLRGIISQQLIPQKNGRGRVLAMEVLINTQATAALIRDGKTFMLPGVMQTGKKIGCKLIDDSLLELLTNGMITAQEAFDRAEQKSLFKQYLSK